MSIGLLIMLLFTLAGSGHPGTQLEIVGPWQVRVASGVFDIGSRRIKVAQTTTLTVAPAAVLTVKDERYESLPVYNEQAAPWGRGAKLAGLVTVETTAAGMLAPESVVVKSGPGAQPPYQLGVDYALEANWATFGRLPGGAIGDHRAVWVDYRFGRGRIDSIVVDRKGNVSLLQGAPHNATPLPPTPPPGSITIANIWVPGRLTALADANLYPVFEPRYPSPARRHHTVAEAMLPKTWAKLVRGQPLHVLAWGDSVTEGGQASDAAHRYQERFVTLLRQRFPAASIQLTTEAWGGRNSDTYLNEPLGSPHNFAAKVLQPHPDLIVMEFVNDAYLTPEQVEARYTSLQKRFDEIGAEWIILTPHYVRPDWMGAATVRVETDPRPYVAGVRLFAARHHVALADASLRWGHLLKEGIPYITLLCNSINHPDDRGHEMFAQSLLELF